MFKKTVSSLGEDVGRVTLTTLDGVETFVDNAGQRFEKVVKPVRKSVLKRFPTLFLFAVTVGVVSISASIEQILINYNLLNQHPWQILLFGVFVLGVTGTIYKKLG